MASFLDNSSDIILDAVLTDYGRQLLAKGDGSFNIVKFAFGDDEIDYGLWDSGSVTSLKDTNILQTPVMEAFTNNAASLKSKLLTIGIENLLYLPILKINNNGLATNTFNGKFTGFVVPVDTTSDLSNTSTILSSYATAGGLIYGDKKITIDQGLDSSNLNKALSLRNVNPELYETEYNISIDNRLGSISTKFGVTPIQYINVDDDNIATYKVSQTIGGNFVVEIPIGTSDLSFNVINGYQGSRVFFAITPSQNLIQSNTLFNNLGEVQNLDGANDYYTIRTSVRVTGVTTGYSLDLPILFAKKK